jgi:molybdopterin-guanine dinucleotide biosynthesis protein A
MIAGIFVGGASRRMGGRAKGLLEAPTGGTLVARWDGLFRRLGVPAVLVGQRPEYAGVELASLPDLGTESGPIGGLLALLAHAAEVGEASVIAVACDMPFVSEALLRKLAAAPPAPAVAARREGRWEPFLARYDVRAARPIALRHADEGKRSLQALLDALGATELPLSDGEATELRDWDTPEDRGAE